MHFLDWIVLSVPLLVVATIGIYMQRRMKSVADFMSGGRLADRYLLAVARGELQAGAVVFVALFEVIGKSGFTLTWWSWLQVPVMIVVSISGFVVYRYRETRAMTLGQFFEIRYSKRFRLFTGCLAFIAGILNFGIIPAVGARFLTYFMGLPQEITLGSLVVPTFIPLMGFFLCVTLFITLSGGLLTVMITDCIEGILSQFFYVVIIIALVLMFSWSEISEVLANRPAGQSLLNPFDSSGLEDFNIWYVLMVLFGSVYGTMAWQNASAYNSAAITAHESRMAGVLGRWREMGKTAVVTLLAVCAITYLAHPDFTAQAAPAHASIAQISDPQVKAQMTIPVALSYLLPIGIKGILCAVLLMGIFGGDSTHLHSWGGIFIQDILVPLRKRPFSPQHHIWLLRAAIVGVALFAFIFGSLFQQTEYIVMWWQVTTAVFVGGAGSAIIGGLYWKRGTTAGAWAALLTGSILSVAGILARQVYREGFPLNGTEISFVTALTSIAVYVVVSWLTSRGDFNLERMLHRGAYAAVEESSPSKPQVAPRRRLMWSRIIGIDEDFSTGDKWIAGGLFIWSIFWCSVMVVGSVWNLVVPWPLEVWSTYWNVVGIGIPIFMAVVAAIWFTWGGIRDMRAFFRRLSLERVNHLDDGTVVAHRNLDENKGSATARSGADK